MHEEGTAMVIIEQTPLGLVVEGRGTFEPGDDSLLEKLSLAAVAAIDAELKKLQDNGYLSDPIVMGDPRAIEKSVYKDHVNKGFPNPWE